MNTIHPTAVIEKGVKLGKDNLIGPFCYIAAGTTIGNGNKFTSHVVIGGDPQHASCNSKGYTEIGNCNTFREFSQVHSSMYSAGKTVVGSNCYFMKGAHIAHDCILEDHIVMANDVFLGGHVYVMHHTNIGPLSTIHQKQTIGSYCQLGMSTVVPKNTKIKPGHVYAGNPAASLKQNSIALDKYSVSPRKLVLETEAFEDIIRAETLKRDAADEDRRLRILREQSKQRGSQFFQKLYSRIRGKAQ